MHTHTHTHAHTHTHMLPCLSTDKYTHAARKNAHAQANITNLVMQSHHAVTFGQVVLCVRKQK